MAKATWFGGLGLRFVDGDGQQLLQWLLTIAIQSFSSGFELCLMVIWMLWKNRNHAVWNGAGLSPQELVVRSESWLQEYQKWHKSPSTKSNRPV